MAGAVFTLAACEGVARTSGSGWVQALGAVLAGILAVGLLGPRLALARTRCTIVANPLDAAAGCPVELVAEVTAAVRLAPQGPPGPETLTGGRRRVTLEVVPPRRGVLDAVVVEVGSAAPFGLLWWTVTLRLPLARPLTVAPRLGPPDATLVVREPGRGEDLRRVPTRVGEPRGVRTYEPGDRRHWIHWPATAHTGELMVREMEGPAARPLVVRVALPADPDQAEAMAERALGTVARAVELGRTVRLVTREAEGGRDDLVAGVADAGRRLARAVAGSP